MSFAEIYTKNNCGYCVKAKQLLNSKGIQIKETLIEQTSKEAVQKLVVECGSPVQVKTVPQIFYTDKTGKKTYIGGYSDLLKQVTILET